MIIIDSQLKLLSIVFFATLLILFIFTKNVYADLIYDDWKTVPLVTEQDLLKQRSGGEGFQMVQSIVFAPSNPSILYLSTDTSQVWKSTDVGRNWKTIRNNFLSNGAVSLAVSPEDSDIVFAAGSYGTDRERAKKYPNRIEGIYLTVDGGENWELIKSTNFYRSKNKGNLIAFAKKDSLLDEWVVLVASHSDGLILTHKKGKKWDVIDSELDHITDIYVHPSNPVTAYIASNSGLYVYSSSENRIIKMSGDLPGAPLSVVASPDNKNIWVTVEGFGVYKSIDYGISFISSGAKNAITLSISPVDPDLLFSKGYQSRPREPLVSTNGGETWSRSVLEGFLDKEFDKKNNQFWFSSPIAPHPKNKNIVFTVSNGKGRILKSIDSGKHWEYSGSGFTGARMMDAAFLPNGKVFFAMTDHGIWVSESGDSGPFKLLKTPRVNKLNTCSAIAVSENVIVVAIGSWAKQALVVSDDSGATWKTFLHTEDRYRFIGFDPNDSNYIYAGKYISSDKGKTWNKVKYDIRAVDENGWLYAVNEYSIQTTLLLSKDNGKSWKEIVKNIPVNIKGIIDVEVNSDINEVYLATAKGLMIIRNSEIHAVSSSSGLAQDIYGMSFVEGVVEGKSGSHLYVARRSPGWGQSNGVFFSSDEGKSWKNITDNLGPYLTVWSIKYNAENCNIYIGTSLGIYRRPAENSHICN